MLVDALSYIGNLFAECTPRPRSKKRLELIMSGVSFALLLYFTTDFIIECWGNIYHKDCLCGADDPFSADPADDKDCHLDQDTEKTCEPEEEVNAYIVMGFALGGLLFDILSLYAYKYFSSDKGDEHAHHHHPGDKPLSHHHGEEHAGHNVNMLSALMHVFSDLLRSTTTFVESLVLLNYPNISGEVVDGWCGLVVCILIALGAVYSLAVWIMEVYSYCTDEEDEEEEDPANFYKQLGDVADV